MKDVTIPEGFYLIPETEGRFYINKRGDVWSIRSDKFVVLSKQMYYSLTWVDSNGKNRAKRIHRIVAEMFIPNPENKPEVNHKDCNRYNNNIDNLEWCTHKENMEHSKNLLRMTKSFKSALSFEKFLINKKLYVRSNGSNFIQFYLGKFGYDIKKEMVKEYPTEYEHKDKDIILDLMKKSNFNMSYVAKELNLSRERIRQIITKMGYNIFLVLYKGDKEIFRVDAHNKKKCLKL